MTDHFDTFVSLITPSKRLTFFLPPSPPETPSVSVKKMAPRIKSKHVDKFLRNAPIFCGVIDHHQVHDEEVKIYFTLQCFSESILPYAFKPARK